MKKFTSLLLSTAMLGGMISAVPASAAEGKIYSTIDVVLLQKYLLGKATISEKTFKSYDVNGDGVLNVFDWVSMKYSILNTESKESELTEFRSNFIAEADCTAVTWMIGMQKDPVIATSAQQLQNNMMSMFPVEFVRALAERYDTEFFKEHDLVLDFHIQGQDGEKLVMNKASMTEDTIYLNYNKEYIDGSTETGIMLTQIVIPKITHSYQFNISIEGETQIPYEFSTMTQSGYFNQPMLFDTYEKYQNYDFPERYQNYTEEFFETNAIYVYTDHEGYPQGSQRYCPSVSKSGNVITITIVQRTVESDEVYPFADVLILNKEDIQNAEIQVKTIKVQG